MCHLSFVTSVVNKPSSMLSLMMWPKSFFYIYIYKARSALPLMGNNSVRTILHEQEFHCTGDMAEKKLLFSLYIDEF